MNILNRNSLAFIIITLFSGQTFAKSCESFAGNFTNVKDAGRGQVVITQNACSVLELKDNGGNTWKVLLDGTEMQLPPGIKALLGSEISSVSYSGKLGKYPNDLTIKAHGRINKLGVNVEVDYEAAAYVVDFHNEPSIYGRIFGLKGSKVVELRTTSLKVVGVDENGVIRGETSGFIQGANWIINQVKGVLDARLE
jgi:hypothetical protein